MGTRILSVHIRLADQLEKAGRTWKGYMDSMPAPCTHTEENTFEESQVGYSARHNPFVYYRSIVDNEARCRAHDVPLTELWKDQKRGAVPDYSFVVPDTCHDGHDSAAQCKHGGGIDYSMLKTVEDIFCLDYLGGAGLASTKSMISAIGLARCARSRSR